MGEAIEGPVSNFIIKFFQERWPALAEDPAMTALVVGVILGIGGTWIVYWLVHRGKVNGLNGKIEILEERISQRDEQIEQLKVASLREENPEVKASQTLSATRRANIKIATTKPVNQASEPWLEWLHVEASPPARELPETAISWIVLNKQVYDGRWQSDRGPAEEMALRWERPGNLPVVIRSQKKCDVMGTPIDAGVCYITDVNFQVHNNPAIRVNPGIHELFVLVRTRENKDAAREFRLVVPLTINEPIRVEQV
jgi:hypothetical protein